MDPYGGNGRYDNRWNGTCNGRSKERCNKIVVSVIFICTIVDIRGSVCAGMINMMLSRMAIIVCMIQI